MVYGLGKKLQQKRLELKMSQKEVAVYVGVSPSIISNYEAGERTPSVEVLMSLANLYCCSTDYLLGIEKSNNSCIDSSMLNEEQTSRLQHFLASLK